MNVVMQHVIHGDHHVFRRDLIIGRDGGLNRLRHHHNQPGRDAMPGDIADAEPEIARLIQQRVIIIAADFFCRKHRGRHLEIGVHCLKVFRQQRRLNALRQFHLGFHAQVIHFESFAQLRHLHKGIDHIIHASDQFPPAAGKGLRMAAHV